MTLIPDPDNPDKPWEPKVEVREGPITDDLVLLYYSLSPGGDTKIITDAFSDQTRGVHAHSSRNVLMKQALSTMVGG